VTASDSRIQIIGIGSDGLASHARDVLSAADVVYGSRPVLQMLSELRAEQRALRPDLERALYGHKGWPSSRCPRSFSVMAKGKHYPLGMLSLLVTPTSTIAPCAGRSTTRR